MAKLEDLFIVVDVGTLNEVGEGGNSFARVRVSNKAGKIIDTIDSKKVQWGYGIGNREAIEDFIRRNPSNIIERIFDAA